MSRYFITFLFLVVCQLVSAQQPATNIKTPLTGYVDMHAHPRGDLAYGTELFYGAPYGDISVAMGNCKPDHSAHSIRNKHGNLFRQILAQQTEQQNCKTWKDSKQ